MIVIRRILVAMVLLFGAGFLVLAIALILPLVQDWRSDQGVPAPTQTRAERQAEHFLVTAAHPLAAEAGRDVLARGGHAVDAAVAVQMVLGFVEPQESGPGGGGFLLYRDGQTGEMSIYDGRETAPSAASSDRFMTAGFRRPLALGVVSGQAVGVPGLVAMLDQAHREHGRLEWGDLLEPARALAAEGVPMPDRLTRQIAVDRSLYFHGDTRRFFVRQGRQNPPRLLNPALSETLEALAADGAAALYGGDMAAAVVEAANSRRPWPGDMTTEDLAAYQPVKRQALCGAYREWTICGAPPPSSGGLAVLQILGLLERFDLKALGPDSVRAVHLITEASRLAFADRFFHVGDPAFVDVPVAGLVDPAYLAERSLLIDPRQAMERALPGQPGIRPTIEGAPEPVEEETPGTTHFSIVDADGNIVALTSSIEAPFGSRIMTGGFLLNNQLTDFSFRPALAGRELPNRVEGGKRPRSSMSPTIVLDGEGEVRMVIGSRGGSRIIGYVVKTLIGVLDWNLPIQEAASLPNFVYRGQGLELERNTELEQMAPALRAMGHQVRMRKMTSGLNGMEFVDGRWSGSADPRLDAEVRGN